MNPLSTQLDPKNCEMGRQLLDSCYDFKENTAIVQSTYCSRKTHRLLNFQLLIVSN